MTELNVTEIKQINGGLIPAIIGIAGGLVGAFEGGRALGHYLYSRK